MRVDNLKLDGPDSIGPELAKIEEELKNIHGVINNLNSVNEKKVASHFIDLEGRLSKMESSSPEGEDKSISLLDRSP